MTEYQHYLKNLSEKVICLLLVLLIILIPASHYVILAFNEYYNLIQNCIYICSISMGIVILLGVLQGGIRFKNNCLLIIIGSLMAIAFLSTFTSIDVTTSVWGDSGRYEGLFMLISYYTIFLGAMAIEDKKRVLRVVQIFMLVGVIHCLYGIFQEFNILENIVIDKYDISVSGVAGNPNFMGTYTVLLAGLSSAFFYYSKTLKNRILYLSLTLLFLLTMIFTDAMSAVFGTAFMILFFFIWVFTTLKFYDNKSEKLSSFKFLMASVALFILLFTALTIYTGGSYVKEIVNAFQDVFSSSASLDEYSGSGRFLVWAEALSLVPNYWLVGSGPDTFGLAYHAVFPVRLAYFNKAHNELIQIILTQGVPALILYLSLYFVVFKNFLVKMKNNYKNKTDLEYDFLFIGLAIAFIGYFTQAMFNISTIDVAPFFWMILGFLAGFGKKESINDFLLK